MYFPPFYRFLSSFLINVAVVFKNTREPVTRTKQVSPSIGFFHFALLVLAEIDKRLDGSTQRASVLVARYCARCLLHRISLSHTDALHTTYVCPCHTLLFSSVQHSASIY